jgi:hypothetical protein
LPEAVGVVVRQEQAHLILAALAVVMQAKTD